MRVRAFERCIHFRVNCKIQHWVELFCNRAYQNIYFMVIYLNFINSKELLEALILVIDSKRSSNVI